MLVACPSSTPGFVDVTAEVGLLGIAQWNETAPVPCLLEDTTDCQALEFTGGVAVRDVDGDGRDDLFVPTMEAPDRLLRNTASGFVELDVGLPSEVSFHSSAAFADVDDDGDPDLYVGGVAESSAKLYLMEGGRYVESGEEWGVAQNDGAPHTQMSACFGDLDGDGSLDLHVTEWHGNRRTEHARLFLGDGTSFRDVTDAWGASMVDVGRAGVWSFTSNLLDVDGDGRTDLFVAADFESSRVFWNEGDRLLDGTDAARVGTDENGMGSALGDIDGDGDLDWFVSSIYDPDRTEGCVWGSTGNRLFRNDGARRFTDITDEAGVRDTGWGWGARFFDYDLDGDLDLVVTNGSRTRCAGGQKYLEDRMRLFENDGTGRFRDVGRGLDGTGQGRGLVTFDYDLDGDEDVLVMRSLDGPRLWRNDVGDGRAWLVVQPRGTRSNRDGFGAVVRVWPDEGSTPMVRHAGNGCGFLGHTPGTPRFGLGDRDQVHRIEVTWPGGATQTLENVPTRQTLVIEED